MSEKPNVAIVTGASKGIGSAIVQRLAQDGFSILVNFATDEASATKLVESVNSNGGNATAAQADVGNPDGAASLFDIAENTFGAVNVLVNNAGVMRGSPIAAASDEDFDLHCSVNFGGAFRGMREGAKRLRDGGRIINVSSSVVGFYQPAYGLYAASKAAVEAMTHVLAKELGSRGITVNAISPGPVETDLFLRGKSEELIGNITKMIPLGRLGRPSDIANTVSFLAGPDSAWVNGQIIRTNGGAI